MKRRNANMIFNKNGNGFDTTKITIPVVWAKELGFTKDDKTAILKFDSNKIIIEKGEIKMFKVIKFYDVYRKDLLNKYGSKNYYFYGDFTTTTEEVLAEFLSEKEAKEFAKKEYEENTVKYSVSGNDIYLIRYDVLKIEDEDNPENIESFGLSLEDYEELN